MESQDLKSHIRTARITARPTHGEVCLKCSVIEASSGRIYFPGGAGAARRSINALITMIAGAIRVNFLL